MSFSLQLAGKFSDSDDQIYFSDKFALYFYETVPTVPEDLSANISEKEFKYISDEEYLKKCLENGREFMIYENYLNNITTTFNLETNNLMLPVEIINNLIETFTTDINDIIDQSNSILLPLGKQLNKIDKNHFNQNLENDIYTNHI
jgi:hypothetical protein